ncbi:MAG: diacylglycerol kinase [Flaviaesturariibacter sp.]|nr:diacylglycerol kinase [Flaviaesturariibacter sp.]
MLTNGYFCVLGIAAGLKIASALFLDHLFMRHILYIINPISGTRNKANLRGLVERQTGAAGISYSIFPSAANSDYSYLDETLQQGHVTDIVIAGGDGTINGAIFGLKKWGLPFGIIPCGSGNGLAFSAGIPKAAERALEIIFRGNNQLTDGFLINDAFACMLVGLGFDAQVAHDFANDPKRGLSTYIRKTVSHFFTACAYPFTIEINGKKLETEAFFISIANSNQFGNNFTIAPKALLTDGLLDIVIVTKQNKLGLLMHTLRQVTGFNNLSEQDLPNHKGAIIYFQTTKLTITNPLGAPMHIDGDPVATTKRLDIHILPQCFKLIVP